jgi:hypothetical protein
LGTPEAFFCLMVADNASMRAVNSSIAMRR